MPRLLRAAAFSLALGTLAGPASAQYGGYDDGYRRPPRGYDYDESPPRRRYDPDRDYDRRRFDDRRGGYDRPDPYGQPQRPQQPAPRQMQPQPTPQRPAQTAPRAPLQAPGRGTCVTPRGSCDSPAGAPGGGCVCFVPGAGNVGGRMQ